MANGFHPPTGSALPLGYQTRWPENCLSHRVRILIFVRLILFCLIWVWNSAGTAVADSAIYAALEPADLKKLSVEQLMNIEVTLVTRQPQRLSESASAIQVITAEDIRRSGATNVPDALRLLPNLEVQQIASHAWVVSARGFDQLFSNKMLVMIDGRTVYSPLQSGVFWDAQNLLIDNIERIEVISGPGGTLWGANAVNGIINIVTKHTRETRGVFAVGTIGSHLESSGAVRAGGTLGEHTTYRAYVERFVRDHTFSGSQDALDSWYMTHTGFRVDFEPNASNEFRFSGNAYDGTEFNAIRNPSYLNGQSLLGRWTHAHSPTSTTRIQIYFDRTERIDKPSTIIDQLHTYDVDAQRSFAIGSRHNVLCGVGYRFMHNNTPINSPIVGFIPPRRDMRLYSAFVQDEIALNENSITLTIGTKVEHNVFTGFEIQPSARLGVLVNQHQTVWGAVSRAVRAPSRIDRDYHIPTAPPYLIIGGPEFESETVMAYELGYRIETSDNASFSVATYFNVYDKLYNVEQVDTSMAFPYSIQNGIRGETWGIELSGIFQPMSWCRLRGGYTYFHKNLWAIPGHIVLESGLSGLGNDPEHQAVVQLMTDLPASFEFGVTTRYTDRLPAPPVESNTTMDAKLSWRSGAWQVSVAGQNLLEKRHVEYGGNEIERSVYGQITCSY